MTTFYVSYARRKPDLKRALPVLIGLAVAIFASSLLYADAQETRRQPFRIGFLHPAWGENPPSAQGLKAGLKAAGLQEGRDVVIEARSSQGSIQALPEAVRDFVRARVDLIVTEGESATITAKAVTQTVPIVFMNVGDPVAAGLVTAIARPGTNVTGISGLTTELAPKRLELLKAVVPTLKRVWAVYHADDHAGAAAARKAEEVAPLLHLTVLSRPVHTSEELANTLKGIPPGEGLFAPPDPFLDVPGQMLVASLWARLPIVYVQGFWVRGIDPGRGLGGLVSYGADFEAEGFQAARLVAKILRGAKPQDLPVEGATRIQFAINLNTAKAFRIAVPREVLTRADEVIQ
jgi:putative ABC transport system substrate-binding protein